MGIIRFGAAGPRMPIGGSASTRSIAHAKGREGGAEARPDASPGVRYAGRPSTGAPAARGHSSVCSHWPHAQRRGSSVLRPKGRGLAWAQRLRQFGDELEQLHGPSGFPAPFSEPQFGGVAPAKRPNVSGYINQEREVNGMVSARPLRRAQMCSSVSRSMSAKSYARCEVRSERYLGAAATGVAGRLLRCRQPEDRGSLRRLVSIRDGPTPSCPTAGEPFRTWPTIRLFRSSTRRATEFNVLLPRHGMRTAAMTSWTGPWVATRSSRVSPGRRSGGRRCGGLARTAPSAARVTGTGQGGFRRGD